MFIRRAVQHPLEAGRGTERFVFLALFYRGDGDAGDVVFHVGHVRVPQRAVRGDVPKE